MMMPLSDKEWNNYLMPDIFKHIQRGKRLKKADHIEGIVPYVSSTANNNGVDGYIEASKGTRVFENCISLANSGSVGKAFYEPFKFVASDHVTSLKNEELKNWQYLFLTSAIEKQGSNFNFNREINDARIKKMQVMLPVTDKGDPDYAYMSEYVQEQKEAMLAKYRDYANERVVELGEHVDIPALDEKEWSPFKVDDLFSEITTGKIANASAYLKSNIGNVEYVAATNKNNGCLYFFEESEELSRKIQKGNCVGFIKDGDGSAGYAIYKKENFVSTVNVIYGYSNWLNTFTGLFFVAAQDKIENKYGHGYKRNQQHLRGDKVMLPIDDKGDPDFEYMEQYAKNLMLRKYKKYLTFLEKRKAKP